MGDCATLISPQGDFTDVCQPTHERQVAITTGFDGLADLTCIIFTGTGDSTILKQSAVMGPTRSQLVNLNVLRDGHLPGAVLDQLSKGVLAPTP
jgi:hypothetical protein